MSTIRTSRAKLQEDAVKYWKAVYVCSSFQSSPPAENFPALDELRSSHSQMARHYSRELRRVLVIHLESAFVLAPHPDLEKIAMFLAAIHDEFEDGRLPKRALSEICSTIGKLRPPMDAYPPHAMFQYQGSAVPAFIWAEEMLARDLGFLYRLFLEAHDKLSKEFERWAIRGAPSTDYSKSWVRPARENRLTLGRSVAQSAFNLLEAYVSSLQERWLAEHPGMESRLPDERRPLKVRLKETVKLVTDGQFQLDIESNPAKVFFDLKAARDSVVHFRPEEKKRDLLFRLADEDIVRSLVQATCALIRMIDKQLEIQSAPHFLRDLPEIDMEFGFELTIAPQPKFEEINRNFERHSSGRIARKT